MSLRSIVGRTVVVAAAVAALGACGASSSTATVVPQAPVASGAFSYACAAGGDCGVFMTISNTNGPADKVVAVTTNVTSRAELHTMVMDPQGTTAAGSQGNMMMKQVDSIAIPAAGTVDLKPGAFHVMLFGLNKELNLGDTFPLTLTYEHGGQQTVQVQVQAKN